MGEKIQILNYNIQVSTKERVAFHTKGQNLLRLITKKMSKLFCIYYISGMFCNVLVSSIECIYYMMTFHCIKLLLHCL